VTWRTISAKCLGVPVIVLLLFASAISANVAAAISPLSSSDTSISMFDDHGGAPLFTVTEMHAGDQHTACIDVTVSGAAPNKTVLFAGHDITGELATSLSVSVSAGPVTNDGCNRFVGTPIYNGTLADLSAVQGDGVPTAWLPIANPVYRFKLTVTAGPKLGLEQKATATFSWRTVDVSSAPILTRTMPPPLPRNSEINGPDSPITKVELKQDARPWGVKALSAVGAVAADFLRHPQYPMALFALAFLFIVLQEWIDRRDPKLADAPVRNDDLRFTERPSEVRL